MKEILMVQSTARKKGKLTDQLMVNLKALLRVKLKVIKMEQRKEFQKDSK